jgi:restriction endonuclease
MTFGKNTLKGYFKPKNPQKYKGNPNNIIYRSSWELRCMKYFDDQEQVIWWASEELSIPYFSPVDNRMHRYFPDFIIKVKQKDGKVMTYVIEVKPAAQTQKPVQKKRTKKYISEAATYVVNQCKCKAADEFCQEHGWVFQIITERELGIK